MKNGMLLILLSVLSFSTAKAQRDSADKAAMNMKPIEGKVVIFVIRPSGFYSTVNPYMQSYCDGKGIGSNPVFSYVYTVVDPGKHVIMSRAENKSTLELDFEAGRIYYFEQQGKPGITSDIRTKLKLLTEEEAKEFLKQCTLSKYNVYTYK